MKRRQEDLEEDFDGLDIRKKRPKLSLVERHLEGVKKTLEKGRNREMTSKSSLTKMKSSMLTLQSPLLDFTECNAVLTKVMTLSIALKMKLFEILEKSGKEMTAEEIRDKISPKTHVKHVMSILEKLHFHDYLDKFRESPHSKYKNSKYTKKYFLIDSEESFVSSFKGIDRYLKRFQTCEKKMSDGKFENLVTELYQSKEETSNFVEYFLKVNQRNFENLLEIFDFSGYNDVLDSSGKNGALASMIKSKHPELNLTSFDHPMLEEFAREYLKAHKMSNDVKLLFGHIREAEMPECDVIIAPHILQFFFEDDKKEILLKMFESIRKEGYLIILENLMYGPEFMTETASQKVSLLLTL